MAGPADRRGKITKLKTRCSAKFINVYLGGNKTLLLTLLWIIIIVIVLVVVLVFYFANRIKKIDKKTGTWQAWVKLTVNYCRDCAEQTCISFLNLMHSDLYICFRAFRNGMHGMHSWNPLTESDSECIHSESRVCSAIKTSPYV